MAFGLGMSLGPFWVGGRLGGGGRRRASAAEREAEIQGWALAWGVVFLAVVGTLWLAVVAVWGAVMGVLLLWGCVGVVGRLLWAVLYSPSRWAEGDFGVGGERRFAAARWFAASGVSRRLFFRDRVVDMEDPGQVESARLRAVKSARRSADWAVLQWVVVPLLVVGSFVGCTWAVVAWNGARGVEEARTAEIASGERIVQYGHDFCRDRSQRGEVWKLCVDE